VTLYYLQYGCVLFPDQYADVIIVEVDVVAVAFQSQSPFPTVSIPMTMHLVDQLVGSSAVDSDHCSASDMQFYDNFIQ
jgi:hypothetical protein